MSCESKEGAMAAKDAVTMMRIKSTDFFEVENELEIAHRVHRKTASKDRRDRSRYRVIEQEKKTKKDCYIYRSSADTSTP